MHPESITFKNTAGDVVTLRVDYIHSVDDQPTKTLVTKDGTAIVVCEEDSYRVFTEFVRSLK